MMSSFKGLLLYAQKSSAVLMPAGVVFIFTSVREAADLTQTQFYFVPQFVTYNSTKKTGDKFLSLSPIRAKTIVMYKST
jgi:hypothetical protein